MQTIRTTPAQRERIASLLDTAVERYHQDFRRERDPVSFAHRYPRPEDQEIVAFLCALLAYGNVRAILASCATLLGALGDRPRDRVLDGIRPGTLPAFRHRFTTHADLELVLAWITSALRNHGSLEGLFLTSHPSTSPMRDRLGAFVEALWATPVEARLEAGKKTRIQQLRHLVSHPARGSACKRLNLFLRWMVRQEQGSHRIDLGLWTQVRPAALVLPVDTHLLKILHQLRWTKSRTATWDVAEAATAQLRHYSPEDPVRFDFALCHLSMQKLTLKDLLKKKAGR